MCIRDSLGLVVVLQRLDADSLQPLAASLLQLRQFHEMCIRDRGYPTVKVFTKPSNKAVFESLAFETLAETDSVVFMENGQTPLRD